MWFRSIGTLGLFFNLRLLLLACCIRASGTLPRLIIRIRPVALVWRKPIFNGRHHEGVKLFNCPTSINSIGAIPALRWLQGAFPIRELVGCFVDFRLDFLNAHINQMIDLPFSPSRHLGRARAKPLRKGLAVDEVAKIICHCKTQRLSVTRRGDRFRANCHWQSGDFLRRATRLRSREAGLFPIPAQDSHGPGRQPQHPVR